MRSPIEYYFRYHDITVLSPDGGDDLATGIVVDRYRLGATPAHFDERSRLIKKAGKIIEILRKTDPSAALTVRVSTLDGVEEHSFDNPKDEQLSALLRYPYVGKGSPESIQVLLQVAATDLPGSPAIVRPDEFQAYCDKWLGLDCSGYVGCFLRHEYQGIPWHDVNEGDGIESNDLITDIWAKFDGIARNNAGEIDADELNLLCMVDATGKIIRGGGAPFGHIMISGPGERAEVFNMKARLGIADDVGVPAICVAESTGAKDPADGNKNGLVRSFYAYADRKGQAGVMNVNRGFNNSSFAVRVKGAAWNG